MALEEVVDYTRRLAQELGPRTDPDDVVRAVVARYPQIARKHKILTQVRQASRCDEPPKKIENMRVPELPQIPVIVRPAAPEGPDGDSAPTPQEIWSGEEEPQEPWFLELE